MNHIAVQYWYDRFPAALKITEVRVNIDVLPEATEFLPHLSTRWHQRVPKSLVSAYDSPQAVLACADPPTTPLVVFDDLPPWQWSDAGR
jgi:hypothetical protein